MNNDMINYEPPLIISVRKILSSPLVLLYAVFMLCASALMFIVGTAPMFFMRLTPVFAVSAIGMMIAYISSGRCDKWLGTSGLRVILLGKIIECGVFVAFFFHSIWALLHNAGGVFQQIGNFLNLPVSANLGADITSMGIGVIGLVGYIAICCAIINIIRTVRNNVPHTAFCKTAGIFSLVIGVLQAVSSMIFVLYWDKTEAKIVSFTGISVASIIVIGVTVVMIASSYIFFAILLLKYKNAAKVYKI
ncbi:MAG: hypothetical protein PHV07_07445 [Oscillospiraceae bacterium]|nr:hypothetical protein [Oscillospiraceae bacterium]